MDALPRRRMLIGALGGAAALAAAGAPAMLAYPARADESPATTYNVREHGAAGDGSADDAPAINALIAQLADREGGIVEFPRGTYLLGSSLVLRSGVHLVSAASGHGYIAAHPRGTNVLLVAAPGLSGWVVDTPGTTVLGAGIAGIDIQGNNVCGGIRFRGTAWCGVRRVHVNGVGEQGVLVEGGMADVFEDVLITNALLHRDRDHVQGAFDLSGTDHTVSRGEFTASVSGLTSADRRVVAAAIRGANHFVSDSVAETSDIGWYITADSCRFTGVRGDTNQGEGFYLSGASNVFAACSSVGNSQHGSGDYDGWRITGGGNSLAACNVVTSSSKLVRHGFTDTVNNRDATTRNTYVGCRVDRSADGDWHTAGYLGSAPEAGRHAVRPASGTSRIDVTQAGVVVLWDYRHRTTVRGFTGGVDGQTIRVLGDPHVTIASGGALVTATGRSVRTKRHRTYTFTRYDGVWYQST